MRWRFQYNSGSLTRSPTWWVGGRTLSLHDLVAFGEPLCEIRRPCSSSGPSPQWYPDFKARDQLVARVQGVVFGQQYLMLDYDCPRSTLDQGHVDHAGTGVTDDRPAGRSRTGSRCARWCPAATSTGIMDEIAAIGAKARSGLRQVLQVLTRCRRGGCVSVPLGPVTPAGIPVIVARLYVCPRRDRCDAKYPSFLLALLIGVVAGLRSLTAPAGGRLGGLPDLVQFAENT